MRECYPNGDCYHLIAATAIGTSRFSADGTKIAYSADLNGNVEIFVPNSP